MQSKTGKAKIILFLFLLPMISRADLAGIQADVLSLVNTLVKIFVGLGVTYFLYGLGSYVGGIDEKGKKAAKDTMIYGIIGLFVMVSIWGIVGAVRKALGI